MKTVGFPGKEKGEGTAQKLQPATKQLLKPGRFKVRYPRTLMLKAALESSHPEATNVASQPEWAPHVYFVWPVKRKLTRFENQKNLHQHPDSSFPFKIQKVWHLWVALPPSRPRMTEIVEQLLRLVRACSLQPPLIAIRPAAFLYTCYLSCLCPIPNLDITSCF